MTVHSHRTRASRSPPRILSLEPIPRCPNERCGEYAGVDVEQGGTIAIRCSRKKCRSHWWATRFRAGSIREQLVSDYEDADAVNRLIALFGLPESISSPMYWQVRLTGEEFLSFNRDENVGRLARSLNLFRGILSLHRRAS